jgi:hypothetical protein
MQAGKRNLAGAADEKDAESHGNILEREKTGRTPGRTVLAQSERVVLFRGEPAWRI